MPGSCRGGARRSTPEDRTRRERANRPKARAVGRFALFRWEGGGNGGSARGEAGLLGGDVEVGGGPLQVEGAEGVEEEVLDGEAGVPLAVGGHDVPGRVVRIRLGDRDPVRLHVVVPARALVEVARIVLPVLVRTLQ